MSTTKSFLVFGICFAVTVLGSFLLFRTSSANSNAPTQINKAPIVQRHVEPEPTPKPKQDRFFSLNDYQKVQFGMMACEINLLTGCAVMGKEIGSGGGGGHRFESFIWQNPDGSNMIGSFVDGRLTNKAQSGLKYTFDDRDSEVLQRDLKASGDAIIKLANDLKRMEDPTSDEAKEREALGRISAWIARHTKTPEERFDEKWNHDVHGVPYPPNRTATEFDRLAKKELSPDDYKLFARINEPSRKPTDREKITR